VDYKEIDGVVITPLKRIHHPKGDILHGVKSSDPGFIGFGEAYFSLINKDEVKGWNKHQKMTLNLIVPVGEVTFVIHDDKKGTFFKISLSNLNYNRLTVPPKLWIGFIGKGDNNLILNVASMEHDINEVDRKDLNELKFDWKLV
tara:strand:+ start:167 stop:598 length:432 start_codon:yes stop_codon:yes gene_type:complete